MSELNAYLNKDCLMISVENLPGFAERISRVEELEEALRCAVKDLKDYQIQVLLRVQSDN
nr:hypothetical protein [uncultured Butyricicoccus sp.]